MAIVTITGPTCAGKSTLESQLQLRGFGRAISHTTRMPRVGEVNGVHYHFVTDFEYDRLKSEGAFIEVIEFGTRRYAMSSAALLAAQNAREHVAIVVEPHGAAQILDFCDAHGLRSLAVWIDCDPKVQAQRYVMRQASDMMIGKESVGAHAERLALMLTEEVKWREAAKMARLSSRPDRHYDMLLPDAHMLRPSALADVVATAAGLATGTFGRDPAANGAVFNTAA